MKAHCEAAHGVGPLLREWQVLQMVPVSRATFHRWLRKGEFPSGCRIAQRIVVWRREVVIDWIDRHVQQFEGHE